MMNLAYNLHKCLITLITSGKSPRSSGYFFRLNDSQINGRGGAETQDPQGEYCSPGWLQVINTAPTNPLNNGLTDSKVSTRSIQLTNPTLFPSYRLENAGGAPC